MAETTSGRLARFLTRPTVVEYSGVIHCGAFPSLSILYSALDSILFIALCSHENSSSPPHSTLGNHIPVCYIDRKLLSAVQTVSNMYTQVTRAQSCVNQGNVPDPYCTHVCHWSEETGELFSLPVKTIFISAFLHWLNHCLMKGTRPCDV